LNIINTSEDTSSNGDLTYNYITTGLIPETHYSNFYGKVNSSRGKEPLTNGGNEVTINTLSTDEDSSNDVNDAPFPTLLVMSLSILVILGFTGMVLTISDKKNKYKK